MTQQDTARQSEAKRQQAPPRARSKPKFNMSLGGRLIFVTSLLIACGLIINSLLTLQQLKPTLVHQVDERIAQALAPLHASTFTTNQPSPLARNPLPSEFYLEFRGGGSTFAQYTAQTDEKSLPVLPANLDSLVDDFTTVQGQDGTPWRVSGLDLYHISGTKIGTVVIGLPLVSEYRTMATMQFRSILIGVAIILIGAVFAFWVIRGILRPLREIQATAQRITAGDFSERVQIDTGSSELTEVADSINTMLGSIEESFESVALSELRTRHFMADASHELRTPLTAIGGYTELIRMQNPDLPGKLSDQLGRIEVATSRLHSLVDQLALLTRLDAGERAPLEQTNLLDIALQALADLQALDAQRPMHLEITGGGNTLRVSPGSQAEGVVSAVQWMVSANFEQLGQIVTNLIGNAVKHTPAGTPVVLRVTDQAPAGYLRLQVSDWGPGIPREQREKIFERFYRGDPSRTLPGNGLGLAIAAQAAEHNHINISVQDTAEVPGATSSLDAPDLDSSPTSDLGVGTTFSLDIPKWPTTE